MAAHGQSCGSRSGLTLGSTFVNGGCLPSSIVKVDGCAELAEDVLAFRFLFSKDQVMDALPLAAVGQLLVVDALHELARVKSLAVGHIEEIHLSLKLVLGQDIELREQSRRSFLGKGSTIWLLEANGPQNLLDIVAMLGRTFVESIRVIVICVSILL